MADFADAFGVPIEVGAHVAFAYRRGNTASLETGTVWELRADPRPYYTTIAIRNDATGQTCVRPPRDVLVIPKPAKASKC